MCRSSAIEIPPLAAAVTNPNDGEAAKVSPYRAGEESRYRSGAAECFAQFVLGAFEHVLLPVGEVLAGAVEVEGQHRHRRLVRRALAPLAGFGRAFQRQRDLMRVAVREHPLFEIERFAATGDLAR